MATNCLEDLKTGLLPEDTLAARVMDCPGFIVILVLLSLMVGGLTVISQVFVTPSTVALIIAVPCLLAVTFPNSSTDATLFLPDFHFGLKPDDTDAESFMVSLRYIDTLEWLSLMVGGFTVTLHLAVVLSALTEMTVFPGFLAMISPVSSISAIDFLLLVNDTAELFEVFAKRRKVPPFSNEMLFLFKVIAVLATVIRHDASPPRTFAVILHVPADLAVMSPYVLTDATPDFELLNDGSEPSLETAIR